METKRRLINSVCPILLALVFLLLGCEQPEVGAEPSEAQIFTATLPGGEATKTVLSEAVNNERNVMWQENDLVRIVGATQADYRATSLSAERTSATLVPAVNGSAVSQKNASDYYEAFYPASLYRSEDGKRILPSIQSYTPVASTDGNRVVTTHLPMYARSATNALTFRNLCAVLNFKLTGTDADRVSRIEVTSEDSFLCGEFEVAETSSGSGDWHAVMKSSGTGLSKTVALDCTGGVAGGYVQLGTEPTEFCLAVPAGTYAKGKLKVDVYGPADPGNPVLSFTNETADAVMEHSKIYEVGETYVFSVTDPADLTYLGGTSTSGKVISYKYTGSDTPESRTAVAWDVEGYYATAADAAAGTNRLSGISATYLNSFTPVSQTGGDAGESVSIEYRADSGTPASGVDPTDGITAKLKSNSGAYVRRGSASSYWNLSNPASGSKSSIKETANTYIVNAPGYYCFPLVMGNGIKNDSKNTVAYRQTNFTNYQGGDLNTSTSSPLLNDQGGTPTSAYVVWEEAKMVTVQNETDWTLPSGCISTSDVTIDGVSKQVYWLNFQITDAIAQGCIVLAVTDGSGTVMWSWTIWVTDYVPQDGRSGYSASSNLADVECTYDAAGNKVTFMPVNLGWVETGTTTGTQYAEASVYVRLRQTGTDNYVVMVVTRPEGNVVTGGHPGHNPTYQWGRKDAMVPASIGEEVISSLSGRTTTYQTRPERVTLAESIQTPDVMFTEAYRDWCSTEDYGWWCAGNTESNVDKATVKTIYDPCPAGYTVPRFNAFLGFNVGSTPTSTGSLSGRGNVESTSDLGYYFWSGWRSWTNGPTTGMKTIFLPNSGHRVSSARVIATGGTYWYAVATNRDYCTFFYLNYALGYPSYLQVWVEVYGQNRHGYQRNWGRAIRPAREEL